MLCELDISILYMTTKTCSYACSRNDSMESIIQLLISHILWARCCHSAKLQCQICCVQYFSVQLMCRYDMQETAGCRCLNLDTLLGINLLLFDRTLEDSSCLVKCFLWICIPAVWWNILMDQPSWEWQATYAMPSYHLFDNGDNGRWR